MRPIAATSRTSWRLFADREPAVATKADYSISGSPLPNIVTAAGDYVGAAWRMRSNWGDDIRGLRASTDGRLEVGARRTAERTTTGYGRGALDVSLSHGLGGPTIAALGLGAGTSFGSLPAQRQ